MAVCYEALENYDKAVEYYSEGINLNPDDYLAYWNRARTYAYNLNDNEKALIDFNKAIELDSNGDKIYQRGNFYNEIGEYNKALLDYNKAIELDPDDMEYLYFRARTYHELKEYTKAISDLLIITQLDKDGSYIKNERYVLNDLGTYYKRLENYDKALEYYTKEINLNQDDHLPYLVRAELYAYNLNDNEKALIDYNKAIELDSIEDTLNDNEKALIDFNKAIKLDPTVKTYRNRAWFYNDIGRTTKPF